MLTVVADGVEALIAHVPDSGPASGVRTQNPVVVLVAEEYLVHDLTLQKAKTMTGYDEWDKWLRREAAVGEARACEERLGATSTAPSKAR